MSYFKDINTALTTTIFNFLTPAVGVQNYIRCTNGELAGWEYYRTDDDGNVMVKIYDKTTGTAELKAVVYVVAGCDIFRGLFSTGVIPSKDIFETDCTYYRIDYV
ncbi:MAG: hypothetical protein PHN88_15970 [Ignavibacteria bacterium]|nr:hypothetical protein [Ignavibacteria bacterium]